MTEPIIVTTTCDQREVLETIARALIEKRLAACCQIGGPVTSYYRWQGKIERAEEWTCQIKSVNRHMNEIVLEIQSLHSYDEPEIISTRIDGGSPGYIDWVWSETNPLDSDP